MQATASSTDTYAVMEVIVQFARAEDRRDMALLKACLTPDARLDYGPATPAPLEGRDVIAATIGEMLAPFSATQHFVTNFAVRVNGDESSSISYVMAHHVFRADGRLLVIGGEQEDQLLRTAGGWRIHRRRFTHLWSSGESQGRKNHEA